LKIQSFYTYHIKSSRIIRSNFNIYLDIQQARKNGEIVSVAENQVIRSIFDIQKRKYDIEEINNLLIEKRKLKGKKSTQVTINRILTIESRLNEILFIPEIISVVVEDKREYKKIIKNSFIINGEKYVRLMCGAGHSRRNTVIFCAAKIEKQLKTILRNGIDLSVPISYNKYNAYFALSFSGTSKVSKPYYTVIPDLVITRNEKVDYVIESEKSEDVIEERTMPIEFNIFDGQGIISVEQATKWSKELSLDYIPSTFIVRNAFMKGMVCVIDFHKYSDEIGEHIIKDVYGNDVNIRDMDLILSKSMFKGQCFYKSIKEYEQQCDKNNMFWGISRFAPKKEYEYAFSNYQFLQALNLDDEKIKNLCEKTLKYFSNVLLGEKGNVAYALLYLLGQMTHEEKESFSVNKILDPVTKSLILNNKLIEDSYVQNHILHSLNRKIKDSYIGNLLLNGNYSTIMADPFAMMEWCFGKNPKGLLKRDEHYSNFWNKKGIKKVAAMRAPLTWRSEVNILNFINNSQTSEWYKYLTGGIVYNIFGIDNMLQADSDFDGDLILTTSDNNIIDSAYGGLPITYDKGKGEKKVINEDELYLSDIKSFDSPIGFITNVSTSLNADKLKYKKGTKQYEKESQRLKLCRFYQGQAIDAAKNSHAKKMPKNWTSWTSTKNITDEELLKEINFNNSIIIDKRPFFMRHLYSKLNRKYIRHNKKYNNYTTTMFGGKRISTLIDEYNCNSENMIEEEKILVERYYRFSPLIETPCIMNKICLYMESKIKELKKEMNEKNIKNNIDLLIDKNIPFDIDKYNQLFEIYKSYKSEKSNFAYIKDFNGKEMFSTLEQYNKYILNEAYKISSDICELANLAVKICYIDKPNDNKQFVWQIFGEGIVSNVFSNKQEEIYIPFLSLDGDVEYLGSKFKMEKIDLNISDIGEGDYILDL
jgi:hypothetical protein